MRHGVRSAILGRMAGSNPVLEAKETPSANRVARLAPDRPAVADDELVELSREECLTLLSWHRVGRVVVSGSGATPVIRPVSYVFDEPSQSVVFRTANGSKLHWLTRTARAAFEIDDADHVTRTGWSVIVAGVTEEVTTQWSYDVWNPLRLTPGRPESSVTGFEFGRRRSRVGGL